MPQSKGVHFKKKKKSVHVPGPRFSLLRQRNNLLAGSTAAARPTRQKPHGPANRRLSSCRVFGSGAFLPAPPRSPGVCCSAGGAWEAGPGLRQLRPARHTPPLTVTLQAGRVLRDGGDLCVHSAGPHVVSHHSDAPRRALWVRCTCQSVDLEESRLPSRGGGPRPIRRDQNQRPISCKRGHSASAGPSGLRGSPVPRLPVSSLLPTLKSGMCRPPSPLTPIP